jgi:lipid A oxidase
MTARAQVAQARCALHLLWGQRCRPASGASQVAGKLGAGLALLALSAACAASILPSLDTKVDAPRTATEPAASRLGPVTERETFIGAYTGAPYTYPSDVRFTKPDGTDFTVHDVGWDAKPFDDPIYYGARVVRWSRDSALGKMVDFTHSKVYSRREQEVRTSGTRSGVTQDETKRVGDIFHHFEFTHGHNMLTLNGLLRLPWRLSFLSPYVGIGAGASLPHTEVQFKGERARTYEYQFAGPAVQFVAGFEVRVPRISYFIEYKFSFAPYSVPLHVRDGSTLFADLWHQLSRWWGGREPAGGWLTTQLASHQLIAGMGYRNGNTLAAP